MLETLARLEKSRLETGLFPMSVLPDGTIAAGEQNPDAVWFDRAVGEAARQIESAMMPASEEEKVMDALATLHRSATGLAGKVPRDLFRPQPLHWRTDRDVALPGGLSGTISVSLAARMGPSGQLTERSERQIVSTIGDSRRTSSETWSLERP